MKNLSTKNLMIATTGLLLASCGGGTADSTENNSDTTTQAVNYDTVKSSVDESTQFTYDMAIAKIPIPFDILLSMDGTGLKYRKDYLNPVSGVSKYSQNNSKALNLGIYGGDLAYNITFEQFNEVGAYIKSAKALADNLSIPLAFDQRALTKFDQFKTNRDSLQKIVFASYEEVDKTLKSNDRIGLASLVITGGWIEGLYTTIKTLGTASKDDKTAKIYAKIWQQKNSLGDLINLLEQFKTGKDYSMLIEELNSLRSTFDNLKVKTEVNADEVAAIAKKIDEIRSKIVAG